MSSLAILFSASKISNINYKQWSFASYGPTVGILCHMPWQTTACHYACWSGSQRPTCISSWQDETASSASL